MAEEKDFMESQDFLGDLFKNVGKSTGASLFEKLSTNARQEALQPLVKSLQIQQFTKPLTELADKAEAAQKAGMAAYIAANPEIDESLLYDGTGDLVNGIMQENNLRFREINRRLSFMDIRNPRYQELANELNKINTTSAQLREDNKKLLGIRNLMKDENRVEELSKGMSSSQQAMYNDILTGNTQNFVNINGKLHWQDPDNADAEPVAISSVDAAGPTYSNSVVMEKHIGLYNEVINAQFVDDTVLHSKINSLWKMDGVGNAGLKSFIFDNQNADDVMGFDTSEWFTQWYEDNNIVGEEAQLAEYERIRNSGVLADGATGNVKQHFSAWYHSKMKGNVASQYNKQQAAKNNNSGSGDFNFNTEGGTPSETVTGGDQEAADFNLKSAFSQTDADEGITVLTSGNLIPQGITLENAGSADGVPGTGMAGMLDNDMFVVSDDKKGIWKKLPFYYRRFSFSNEATEFGGQNSYKYLMSIYERINNKQYPEEIADRISKIADPYIQFLQIFKHETGVDLPLDKTPTRSTLRKFEEAIAKVS